MIIIGATVLPLIREDDWWIRWFDFPRLQILVIGLMLVGWQLLWGVPMGRSRVLLFSALLICVGYQAYRIFPYTPLSGVQVKSKPDATNGLTVRLITANVLMQNREAQRYLQVLADADPDIILTTETDQWWANQLEAIDHSYPYHADYFFLRFPLDHIFHSAHFKLMDLRRLPGIGSDHFPMYAALSFTPGKDAAQRPAEAEAGEEKEAEETVQEAFENKP
ncbi:endonuclease/exonuclease/phosphatase family protein [Desulfosarcina sp.]|uniref:endonuclease/exonuclease/phosphatase family protein n=1 Tax=Desulfosarcina sp. TaxID=2027861 RepID=UPI0039706292